MSADPVREAAQALIDHLWKSNLSGIPFYLVADLCTALAAPRPEPEKFNLHDVVPPSAPEWMEGNRAAVSPDWMSGWDACRNRTRLLVIGLVAAMRQGLAAPEGPAPEPLTNPHNWFPALDAILSVWADPRAYRPGALDQMIQIATDQRNAWLVKFGEPAAAEAPPPVEARQPLTDVTDEMVTAYLTANDAYWLRTDELPKPVGKWRAGNVRDATRESLRAALAAPAGAVQPHLDHQVGAPVTLSDAATDGRDTRAPDARRPPTASSAGLAWYGDGE